jgi:hypothetical protein
MVRPYPACPLETYVTHLFELAKSVTSSSHLETLIASDLDPETVLAKLRGLGIPCSYQTASQLKARIATEYGYDQSFNDAYLFTDAYRFTYGQGFVTVIVYGGAKPGLEIFVWRRSFLHTSEDLTHTLKMVYLPSSEEEGRLPVGEMFLLEGPEDEVSHQKSLLVATEMSMFVGPFVGGLMRVRRSPARAQMAKVMGELLSVPRR